MRSVMMDAVMMGVAEAELICVMVGGAGAVSMIMIMVHVLS